ncbi:MAG: helix-turn-helix domain-containing protein [Deltaproteobacteria bacterium]
MESDREIAGEAGFPELTDLGKRIEMLRIERGLSKQFLARFAGTSRQQLWRVMTGKSELTGALRSRLADALSVSPLEFDLSVTRSVASLPTCAGAPIQFPGYLSDPNAITRTLATMPAGDTGRALKRRLLDALEDMALGAGVVLDAEFFDLRRRVLSGEL